jgi:hypothetical protein
MKANPYRSTVFGVLFAALVPLSAAHAQLGDMLKQATGSGDSSSGLGNLGGIGGALGGSSLTSSSSSNVAGVLQFCIKNNYLGGDGGASSVKDSLMSKLGGGASSDSGYTSGASGILDAGNGKKLDLSGGGLKEQVTKQVCDKILSQAKSLL